MAGVPSTPAVCFFRGEGFTVVGLNVTPLGFAIPKVVALEEGVDGAEVGVGELGIPQVGGADFVQVGCVYRRTFALQFVDERIEDEEESWRVSIVRILDLKFLRHFTAGFLAEDLLSSYPSVIVHEVEPAFDNVKATEC